MLPLLNGVCEDIDVARALVGEFGEEVRAGELRFCEEEEEEEEADATDAFD